MILKPETRSWTFSTLTKKGYKIPNELINQVQDTPWSYVGWIDCSPTRVYIKQMPELIANEAAIIQTLKSEYNATVPQVIEANQSANCFLMNDAGDSLRSVLFKSFDVDLICHAINIFTALQITIGSDTSPLINLGVPNWSLDMLPDIFRNILLDEELIDNEGLSNSDLKKLNRLIPKIYDLCQSLSGYGISETLVQPDCNDNNMLVNNGVVTLIDLGEISISHPFFSIINFLYVIKKHHKLRGEGIPYQKIKSAAFSNYKTHFSNEADLEQAYKKAIQLHSVYWIIASHRLMKACSKERLKAANHWDLKSKLTELINNYNF